MSNNILQTLKKAKDCNQILSIHTNPYNQARCLVVFVDQLDDDWVRFRCISREGKDDGYEIMSLEEIFRIDINSSYGNKINYVKNNHNQVFKEVELSLPIETDSILFATLKEAQQKELIVILWTEDESNAVIGYVDSLDQDVVSILSIDEFGREDGFIILDLAEVTSMDCNSLKCQIIKFLHKSPQE